MVRASTPPAISASAPAVEIAAASTLLEWRRRMLALPRFTWAVLRGHT